MLPVMKEPAVDGGTCPEKGDGQAAVMLEGVRHGWNGGVGDIAGMAVASVVDGSERNGSGDGVSGGCGSHEGRRGRGAGSDRRSA